LVAAALVESWGLEPEELKDDVNHLADRLACMSVTWRCPESGLPGLASRLLVDGGNRQASASLRSHKTQVEAGTPTRWSGSCEGRCPRAGVQSCQRGARDGDQNGQSWSLGNLLEDLDRDPWGRAYRVVMKKLKGSGPRLTETLDPQFVKKGWWRCCFHWRHFRRPSRGLANHASRQCPSRTFKCGNGTPN